MNVQCDNVAFLHKDVVIMVQYTSSGFWAIQSAYDDWMRPYCSALDKKLHAAVAAALDEAVKEVECRHATKGDEQ
ncbi:MULTISPECIES: hypothetical protein [unclassified Desulfovibrio]|uniref:hypothetical protein n=1 Tax=unclassified Desulfovibrio TaxID=2593640 RepID=UPI0013ED5677|nr:MULTISPECIES: hypothetical protein [unclassified Desulfovibrio]